MRLIDADALPVCKEHCIDECGFGANFYVVHKTDIDAAPTITIEAEPVKHGRWEETIASYHDPYIDEYWDDFCYEHKACGYQGDFMFNFCPNCGCKMDLEET